MSLKRQFAVGVVWSVIGNGANNLISFAVFAIIANVVSPTVLGVAAFAIALVELGKMVNGAGIPELLVQRPVWDDHYASMAFWVNITMALVLTAVSSLVVAPIIDAQFAEGSGLALTVLSASFLVDAIRIVQEAKLRREFKYKNLAARGSSAGVLSGIVGVVMALTGFGLWALVAQRVVHSVLMTVFTWYASDWRPGLFWSARELGSMLANGARLMVAGLLVTLSGRIPDLLLGSLIGPVAVAVYRVGARGYEALIQLIIYPMAGASLSGLSRVAGQGSIAGPYVRATKFVALIAYPVFFGAAATAEQFVAIAFGPNWGEASLVMAISCAIMGPATIGHMMRPALASLKMTHEILWINFSVVVTVAIACLATISYGPVGMALALTVRAHIAAVCNLYLLRRLLGVPPVALLKAVLPPYISALIMVVAVLFVDQVLLPGWPNWVKAIGMILAGAIVYPLVLWAFWRSYLHAAFKEVGQMFPRLERLLARFGPGEQPLS